ncbi:hypothetical protein RHCRD62_70073 [Rhodococcus sp. RD6.2]|nr:hypothetical protein RHCRD62_70073 [Rhodococcus sp. RD6.2]
MSPRPFGKLAGNTNLLAFRRTTDRMMAGPVIENEVPMWQPTDLVEGGRETVVHSAPRSRGHAPHRLRHNRSSHRWEHWGGVSSHRST